MAINLACSVPGDECSEPGGTICRGMCSKHYQRWRTHRNPSVVIKRVKLTTCSVNDEECSPPGGQIVKGMCLRHYNRKMKTGKTSLPEMPLVCVVAGVDCSPGTVNRSTGLCTFHHGLLRKGKDPATTRRVRGRPAEFVRSAAVSATDECIEWPFAIISDTGYGVLRWEGRNQHAHRVVLHLAKGAPPEPGMYACHVPVICNNRRCVNPAHLYWGTPTENRADTLLDGTKNHGERCGTAVLTDEQVYAIRADGTKPQYLIAIRYGVSQGTISEIKHRKRWKHLPERPAA